MAGDEDRDRIGAAGGADGARNSAGGLGEVAVGFCAARGDRQHLAPYCAVELGAARLQRQIEAVAVVGEVIAQLRGGLLQKVAAVMATTCRTATGWTGPSDDDDGAVLLGDGDRPGGWVAGEAPTRHGRLAPASKIGRAHV